MRDVLRLGLATATVVGLLSGANAAAAGSADDRCQRTIAAAGRQVLRRSMAVLAACERGVARGALPAGTDCLTHPVTQQRRAAAAAKPSGRVQRGCTDADVAQLAVGGGCAGATTVTALVACLRATHEAEAESLVAVADVTRDPLPAAARACAAQSSREARRFALVRLRLLQQCKRRPPLDLPLGAECRSEPSMVARIAALRARATERIAAACDAGALAETPFGPPCRALGLGSDLALCLLTAAETTGDAALASEFPDPSFCGDSAAVAEARIDELIADMTLDEKIAQMHGNGVIAGTWHTPDNDRLGIPGFAMLDGPRGASALAGNATAFPVGMARGATWDPALEERVGEAIGAEARAKGASVLLAPVLNILRHPRWGRAQETYGEDTHHLGRMGVGFIRGAQAHVVASPKHLAANSIENTRFTVNVTADERTLREVYLPHFRAAVQTGRAGSIMSAYNRVNGSYCAENVHLLHDVLKGDWGFRGFVESDWILGTRSTAPSANAGLDIEMPLPIYYGTALAQAVTMGQVPEAVIDAAVRRILRAKLCFRLDTEPPAPDPSQIESPAHLELALEVARKGIVLLRNAGGALPLDRSAVSSIVVVGDLATIPNLGDQGSSRVVPSAAVAPLAGIQDRADGVAVAHVPGPPLSPGDEAAVAAADAVVVVAGLTAADESEGQLPVGDRATLGLSPEQDQLIAAVAGLNARTIVVLEGGSAITMPWVNDVAAILMAWYPGQQGGNAIADVLFGDVNPSGRLPISFPVAEADLPPFDNVSLAVTYGYYHGYRWLDRQGSAPLYPFGFGLSYTTFAYSNLVLAPTVLSPEGRLRVTADVSNTGPVAGDEIAQLYVGYQGSAVDRAVRDLRGFARVHLEPGETRTVAFEVPAADLAFWDTGAGTWRVEPITYEVRVGPSSRTLPLGATFSVAP